MDARELAEKEIEAMARAMHEVADYPFRGIEWGDDTLGGLWDEWRKRATAAHSATAKVREEAGWCVVPREPTEAMYDALCATNKMWRELDSATVWRVYRDAAAQPRTKDNG